jgi:hypothetical protein
MSSPEIQQQISDDIVQDHYDKKYGIARNTKVGLINYGLGVL